jgi:hypothetical protein
VQCALLAIGGKTLDDVVGHENQQDTNDRRGQHSADYRRGHDSSGRPRPNPDAVQRGTQPRMNANDVMMIGRLVKP